LTISGETIADWWEEAEDAGEYTLGRDRVTPFFPTDGWTPVWELIEGGPAAAKKRVERLCRRWAKGRTSDGNGTREPVGDSMIDHYLNAFRRFAREVDEVRKLTADELDLDDAVSSALAQWPISELPELKTPKELGAIEVRRDRTAPEFRAFRRAIKAVSQEAEDRLKRKTLEDSAYMYLRNRVLFALIGIFGLRRATIGLLQVKDYIPAHRFSDGTEGPALAFRHFKGRPGLVRYKGLPPLVALWLEQWLEIAGISDCPEAYVWRPADARDREYTDVPSTKVIEYSVVNGISPYAGKRCSPHLIRHLTGKVAIAVGITWLYENQEHLLHHDMTSMPSSAQTFEDLALDHELNDPTDRYKDLNSEQGRELWSREIAHRAWDLIWNDKGARLGPDWPRIETAAAALRDSEMHEARVRAAIKETRREQQAIVDKAMVEAGGLEMRDLVVAQLHAVALSTRMADLADQLADAAHSTERAMREYEEARNARVPVPDETSDAALQAEFARLGDSDSAPAEDEGSAAGVTMRPIVLGREFRWAVGENVLHEKALQRYARGESLRGATQLFNIDPETGRPIGVHRPSPSILEIVVDELPLENYPETVVKRLRWLQTQPKPRRSQRPGGVH
jgi:hypothetical protein